jgi:hypothetical protein
VGWTKQYDNSRICYLQGGDDAKAWQNEHYPQLRNNAIARASKTAGAYTSNPEHTPHPRICNVPRNPRSKRSNTQFNLPQNSLGTALSVFIKTAPRDFLHSPARRYQTALRRFESKSWPFL